MRYIQIAGLILAFVMPAMTRAFPETLNDALTIEEIRPDLFIIVHAYPWPSNSLAAIMENGEILIIDTPYTPGATKSVLEWLNAKFGKRKITAVNTHFHVDRLGGNEALIRENIPVYGSDLTAEAIQTRGRGSLALLLSWISDGKIKQYYQNFKYIQPTRVFESKKGMTLTFGGEKALIRYPGPGHSVDNCVVYLPGKQVLFGGCMILSPEATKPGNVSDGNIDAWKQSLKAIETDGYTIVIPGHGKPGGVELIDHTREVLEKNSKQRR